MRIIQLYSDSEPNFTMVDLRGKYYIVNKNNLDETEEVTTPVTYTLCRQNEDYLFICSGRLYRISGVKSCFLKKADENCDFDLLISLDEEDYLCFTSFFLSKEDVKNRKSNKTGMYWKELGKIKASSFIFFDYSYCKEKFESKRYYRGYNGKFSEDVFEYVESFSDMTETFARSLKNVGEEYCLYPRETWQESLNYLKAKEENVSTTFIRIGKTEIVTYEVPDTNFKILGNYNWNGHSCGSYWGKVQKYWVLNGNELFDIRSFNHYDVSQFASSFKEMKVIPWCYNEFDSFIFFTEKNNPSKHLKNGILWNPSYGIVISDKCKNDGDGPFETNSVFWHWNRYGYPNVTIEKEEDHEVYTIWYREKSVFKNVKSVERPIVFEGAFESLIYFVKTKEATKMLVIDHSLKLVSQYDDVTFFEEISTTKKYSPNFKRTINDRGRYFATKVRENYLLESYHFLIVKRMTKDDQYEFGILWNKDNKHQLDFSVPFVAYHFSNMDEKETYDTKWKKMIIEPSSSFAAEEEYYIIAHQRKITTLKEEMKDKLRFG